MDTEATPLTAEDYGALLTMLRSSDRTAQHQAETLFQKLTPAEVQEFNGVVKAQNAGKDATSNRQDSDIFTGVSPETALLGSQALYKVGSALAGGGAAGGVREAIGQAAPYVKYDVVRRGLSHVGVPEPFATIGGGIAAMYRGGTPREVGPVDPAAPHLDRSVPVQAGELTQQQIGERLRFGQGTPTARAPEMAPRPSPSVVPDPPVTAAAAPVSKGPSPTAISSDAALARRRAEYQARLAQQQAAQTSTPTVVNAAGEKLALTAIETGQVLKWRAQGIPDETILERLQTARQFNTQQGLSTPTKAETRFPKGQRGGEIPPSWER